MCGLSTVVTPAGASLTMYREIRSYANSIWDDNNNNNSDMYCPSPAVLMVMNFSPSDASDPDSPSVEVGNVPTSVCLPQAAPRSAVTNHSKGSTLNWRITVFESFFFLSPFFIIFSWYVSSIPANGIFKI